MERIKRTKYSNNGGYLSRKKNRIPWLPMLAALVFVLAIFTAIRLWPGSAGDVAAPAQTTTQPEVTVAPAVTTAPKPDLTAEVKVRMAGDFMLHTGPLAAAQTGEFTYDFIPFMQDMQSYVNGDLNITDIEGAVDAYGDNQDITSYPMFNFPRELLDAIKFLGFDTIVTANNHAYDQGWEGLLATKKQLKNAKLKQVGTYASQEEYDKPYIRKINGIKVGIVAWSALDNGMSGAVGEHLPYAMRKFEQDSLEDIPRMLDDVKKLRKKGAEVVLMPVHWGGEYQDQPSDNQREIARQLLEGGVDILIGDHTHCVQPIEKIKVERNGRKQNALCIYSLGNFFADQLGLDPPAPKTQYGMLVSVTISRDEDGKIDLKSMKYMPTLCYRDSLAIAHQNGNPFGYAFVPAGKYAAMDEQPEDISYDTWQETKAAWEHVRAVAGDDIKAYAGK